VDPELAALSTAAAIALVQSMTTDGWQASCKAVMAMWHRKRPEQADTVGAELARDRDTLSDDETAAPRLTAEWAVRLHDLAAADPGIAPVLRELIAESQPAPAVKVNARVSGHGRIIVAGRDAHVNE